MDLFRRALREELPEELKDMVSRDWIPWKWVQRRYSDIPKGIMAAHFYAYQVLENSLDIAELASVVPRKSGGCLRCGSCCAVKRPGSVSKALHRRWLDNGALIPNFYAPTPDDPSYNCWFYKGYRLRMCPLLIENLADGTYFCSVYHLGSSHRAPSCVTFQPDPPVCETPHVGLVV